MEKFRKGRASSRIEASYESNICWLSRSLARNWLSIVFVILNLIDCLLSTMLTNRGMTELNPLWAGQSVWFKMILVFFFVMLLHRRRSILAALNIGMGAIVLWNLYLALWY